MSDSDKAHMVKRETSQLSSNGLNSKQRHGSLLTLWRFTNRIIIIIIIITKVYT